VLVDAMTTVAEAEALADWVALHNRNLETIYITYGHFDHIYGLSILLGRFPGARAIATAKTVDAMQMSFSPPSGAVSPPALCWAGGHKIGCT
jgi:glyoxylase-like metal-dependent hydrolase (beta-lactamase superfamily II)